MCKVLCPIVGRFRPHLNIRHQYSTYAFFQITEEEREMECVYLFIYFAFIFQSLVLSFSLSLSTYMCNTILRGLDIIVMEATTLLSATVNERYSFHTGTTAFSNEKNI